MEANGVYLRLKGFLPPSLKKLSLLPHVSPLPTVSVVLSRDPPQETVFVFTWEEREAGSRRHPGYARNCRGKEHAYKTHSLLNSASLDQSVIKSLTCQIECPFVYHY